MLIGTVGCKARISRTQFKEGLRFNFDVLGSFDLALLGKVHCRRPTSKFVSWLINRTGSLPLSKANCAKLSYARARLGLGNMYIVGRQIMSIYYTACSQPVPIPRGTSFMIVQDRWPSPHTSLLSRCGVLTPSPYIGITSFSVYPQCRYPPLTFAMSLLVRPLDR